MARSDGAEQRAPYSDNGGQRQGRRRRDPRLRVLGPEEMRTTQSPSRSLELFSEEDDRAAAVAVDGTDEDGLVPSGCCTSVPRITIKGGNYLGARTHRKTRWFTAVSSWHACRSRRHGLRSGLRASVSPRFLRWCCNGDLRPQ